MFYNEKKEDGYFIWSDKTNGKYGPFLSIYSKNIFYGENIFGINLKDFPAYKFSLGFTKTKLFILEENGNIKILDFKQ